MSDPDRPVPIETLTLVRRASVSAILRTFWDGEPRTASDLLATVGLTRATVHSVCAELVERGWIREIPDTAPAAHRHGRPAKRFQLDRSVGYLLALDLRRQHLSAVVADATGDSLFEQQFELADVPHAERRGRQIKTALDKVLRGANIGREQVLIAAVGVAIPVSRDGVFGQGEPLSTTTALWRRIRSNVETLRRGLPGIDVLCANDANLALIGERWRGVAAGVDNLVLVLGTEEGTGSSVMEDGRTLYGHTGGMGELYWQNFLDGPDAEDSIAMMVRQLTKGQPAGKGKQGSPDPADPRSRPVVEKVATAVAHSVRTMAIMLNPEMIVLAGAAAQWRDAIAPLVGAMIERDVHDPPRVESSSLGDAVVAIGALRLALDHLHENALDLAPRRSGHGLSGG
jgi:predicted NBD/HSP70 family sugar kinase